MRRFATLIKMLDATNKTNKKVDTLTQYFKEAPKKDSEKDLVFLSVAPPRSVISVSVPEVSKLPTITEAPTFTSAFKVDIENINIKLAKPVKILFFIFVLNL